MFDNISHIIMKTAKTWIGIITSWLIGALLFIFSLELYAVLSNAVATIVLTI